MFIFIVSVYYLVVKFLIYIIGRGLVLLVNYCNIIVGTAAINFFID